MIWLVLFFVVAVPVAWLISEFQPRYWLRVVLGVAAIGMSYFVAFVVGSLTALNYNAHYGSASAELIQTVIVNLEGGNADKLLRELKGLKAQYQPTYENRANYDKLVNDFVSRMAAAAPNAATASGARLPE